MEKQKELSEKILDLGVEKVGYANLQGILPKEFNYLKSGISIVVRLSDQVISGINPQDGPTHVYFHHYRTINSFIDQVCFKISNQLQRWGYLALPVAASQSINKNGWNYKGLFQHRTSATQSGIGWIGKNCCIITEEFGPRVRLGTVLTNMIFEYDEPINESKCGDCNICVEACPSKALKGTLWNPTVTRDEIVDPELCSQHMKKAYKMIGRGAVCGICVQVCPKGKDILKR